MQQPAGDGIALQLLGPVTLRQGDAVLPLPTHKAQALLVLLALGGPAHRARLAGWLWPHTDDSAARRNLRRELARLREAGAGNVLAQQGEVLALDAAVHCDATTFNAALTAGRHDEALALWRGPPADGLQLDGVDAFADWLATERHKLLAGRRQALQAAALAAEAGGQPETALAHVQALLADDPLQEHHHREAMRLLAASGRREAALAQYARCRELLHNELGLAPTAATETLLTTLRGSTAAASVAQPGPATSGLAPAQPGSQPGELPRELPLVGRDGVWAQMQAAWQAGRGIVIEGDAGIGKTRLAREFAAAQGAYALAQCRRSDADVPYASFTRVLRQLAGHTLAQAELPAWVRAELGRVLPELGPSAPPIASAEEQRRFFEACAAAWRTLTAGSFDSVLIDDWHLADDASRALLGFVVEQQADDSARALFVLRPELDDNARKRLHTLLDGTGALRVQLPPLGPEHVLDLVRRLSGAAEPRRFAQRLERATGGNPFFVAETLRQWLGLQLLSVGPDGIWQTPFDGATPDYGELPVPDTVRDTVLARVQRQSDATRRLLEAAALASEPFTPALLAGACALSEVEALGAIEQAVAAELLAEREGGYAFQHDLVQHALEGALAPERRRLVHRRLALGAESAGLAPADIAHHWEAGGEPQRAVAHRIAAAEAALALYADSDAERHWQAALAQRPTLAQRVRIHGLRWQQLRGHDDHPGLMAIVAELQELRAQALAQAASDPAAHGVAHDVALSATLHAAEILSLTHREAEAEALMQSCLTEPALGAARRAQALRILSQALSRQGRTDEARQATEQALAAGGLAPLQQGELLHAQSYTYFLRGQPQPALDYARRALAIWQAAGSRRLIARGHASIGRSLDMLDQQEAAWAELEKAYALASELRLVGLQREVANNLANNRVNLGEPARAITVIREAWALSPHFSMPAMPVYFLGILLRAHFQLGELGTALDLSASALEQAQALADPMTLADYVCMALDVHTLVGDTAGAARAVAALAGHTLEGLGYIRIKAGFGLVLHALHSGDLAEARAQVQALGDVAALEQPPDQAYARLRQAQLALAEGDAEQALALLQPLQGVALYPEVLAASCTTRLAALRLLGQDPADEVARADAALASGRLPALDALALRRERRLAALRCRDTVTAQQLRRDMAAQLARLADSLALRPALRSALLAKWTPEDMAP